MNDDDFYSFNRLIEFGMGIAVAQQMVKTMNSAIVNIQIPDSMSPSKNVALNFYYVILEGNKAGPFSEKELSLLIADKKIVNETYIWKPGLLNWEKAEKIPEILKLVALNPPSFQQNL
jgi:hypothetical protein